MGRTSQKDQPSGMPVGKGRESGLRKEEKKMPCWKINRKERPPDLGKRWETPQEVL